MKFFKPTANKLVKSAQSGPLSNTENKDKAALGDLSEEDKAGLVKYIKTLVDIVKAHEGRQ